MSGSVPEGAVDGSERHGRIFERLRVALVLLALVPLGKLVVDAFTGGLGVDPVAALLLRTGWWALTCLVITLAITPLRRLTGWNRIIRLRKPLGLIAFLYTTIHLLVYVVIDQGLGMSYILDDILERPFITAGFAAFLLLVPLAATSSRAAIRRIGGKRWQRIHRLIYPAALLGVLHYFWLVKLDTTMPLLYGAIVVVLLVARVLLPRRAPAREGRPRAAGRAASAERRGLVP